MTFFNALMVKSCYTAAMKVIVFGANGKVGSIVTQKLLAADHEVVAFIHGQNTLADHPHLRVVQGDIRNTTDVKDALLGVDAAISTLGSWGTKSKDILTVGMHSVIPAMQAQGIQRIVSLTGSGAKAPGDKWGVIGKSGRLLLKVIAPKILADGEDHLSQLAASSLDWTVVRSPVMNNKGTTNYHLNEHIPGPFDTINRHAVAQAMVDQLTSTDFVKKSPHIHRG